MVCLVELESYFNGRTLVIFNLLVATDLLYFGGMLRYWLSALVASLSWVARSRICLCHCLLLWRRASILAA